MTREKYTKEMRRAYVAALRRLIKQHGCPAIVSGDGCYSYTPNGGRLSVWTASDGSVIRAGLADFVAGWVGDEILDDLQADEECFVARWFRAGNRNQEQHEQGEM